MTWTASIKPTVIAASLTALVLPAPTAHADPDPLSVGAYLHALNATHVPYDNPGRIVDIANTACQQARGGTDFDAVHQNTAGNGYTAGQAGYILGAAVAAFCPDMRPALDRWSSTA